MNSCLKYIQESIDAANAFVKKQPRVDGFIEGVSFTANKMQEKLNLVEKEMTRMNKVKAEGIIEYLLKVDKSSISKSDYEQLFDKIIKVLES